MINKNDTIHSSQPILEFQQKKFIAVQSESEFTYHVPTDFSTMLPYSLTSFLLALFTPFCNVACEYEEQYVCFCMGPLLLHNRLVSCTQILLRRSFDADQLVDLLRNVFNYKFCLALRCRYILSVFIYRIEKRVYCCIYRLFFLASP